MREWLSWNPHFSQPTMMEGTADLDLEKVFSLTLVDFVQRITPDLEEQQEAHSQHDNESETFAWVDQSDLQKFEGQNEK